MSEVERNIPLSMNMIDILLPVDIHFIYLQFLIESILVNTVAWAPYEYGLMLACGSSDGSISVISSTGKHLNEERMAKKDISFRWWSMDDKEDFWLSFGKNHGWLMVCLCWFSRVLMHSVGLQLFFHKQAMKQVYKEHQVNLWNVLFLQDVIVSFVSGSMSTRWIVLLNETISFLENKMIIGWKKHISINIMIGYEMSHGHRHLVSIKIKSPVVHK